jgi:heme A synthase
MVIARYLFRCSAQHRPGCVVVARGIARMGSSAGSGSFGELVMQGVLGGITVFFSLLALIPLAHATLAQISFCTVVAIAHFTSAWWQREHPVTEDIQGTPIHSSWIATATAALLQLIGMRKVSTVCP